MRSFLAVMIFVAVCCAPLQAGRPGQETGGLFRSEVVSDAELDEMRGGFEASAGFWVSFGIERAVRINGELVATASFNLLGADGRLASLPTDLTSARQAVSLGVIQVGPQNTVALKMPELAGTLIQNSLDQTQIDNLTVINATVASAAMLRERMVSGAVKDSIVGGLRR